MRAKLLLGMVAVLWMGMILAVGMENVIKFNTPTLVRAVGFDEGRVIFHFFQNVEFVMLASMLMLVFQTEMGAAEKMVFVSLLAIQVLQVFWFFPILSHHVDMILAGYRPPVSWDHTIYGWLDMAKLMLLSVLAFRLLFQFGK